MIQQPAAQSTLQQINAGERRMQRGPLVPPLPCPPARLDLAQPFDHHLVVAAVRPAVERQPHPQGRGIAAGQQHAVAPEIVKAQPVFAQPTDQPGQGSAA